MGRDDERDLELLRAAVDKAQRRQGRQMLSDPSMRRIISVVEQFLKDKKLVCYGGTAINNILPEGKQFYDKNTEFPDYDFYSPDAMNDAIELANKYGKAGFEEVEATPGVHHGTYKVYVNFVPVADITMLPAKLYKALHAAAIVIGGIYYTPPDFLRMSMYLELSRPDGDVSRWEKVHKRLALLNEFYPMTNPRCTSTQFSRPFGGPASKGTRIYTLVRKEAVSLGLVFFGAFAAGAATGRKLSKTHPDFDVLSPDAKVDSSRIAAALRRAGFAKVKTRSVAGLWEVIPPSFEVSVDGEIVCAVYQTTACHNYNVVDVNGVETKIATFDTMLSLWLAMLYDSRYTSDRDRIHCMAQFLFKLQKASGLKKRGPLRRFGPECVGVQSTLESVRAEKASKYEQLKDKKGTKEWDEWFLNYRPEVKKSSPKKTRSKPKRSNRKTRTK